MLHDGHYSRVLAKPISNYTKKILTELNNKKRESLDKEEVNYYSKQHVANIEIIRTE
jgi:hypothetical protein